MNKFEQTLLSGDLEGLQKALKENPALANQPFSLPGNDGLAHPLHRVCDGVFNGDIPEKTALAMARLLVRHGADVNPPVGELKDSPLTAACSLTCDEIALYYIDLGADVGHAGCHGGTPLHWAAWCGRDAVVKRLLEKTAEVNRLCVDFRSTPLFWAVHGLRFGGVRNQYHQVRCAEMLLKHGADPSIPNFEGYLPVDLVPDGEHDLKQMLERSVR